MSTDPHAQTHLATGTTAPAESPSGALNPGELFGNRYRIEKFIGRGGQGDVYQCQDMEVPGHLVAVKLLHQATRTEEERAFAMRELRMMAAVSHPAIVQFKDLGWYGARLFFVMPWLQGTTLEDAGQLSRKEVRRIFENIASGVAALHSKGMRHQDIKPSNIFLSRIDGFDHLLPLLLDLGVAARDGDAPVAGSPDYFAPELARAWPTGKATGIGPEADVFALALTLRNALDPKTAPTVDPFSASSLEARAENPVSPPTTPDTAYLKGTFERWLAIDPEQRPTARVFLTELQQLTAPEDQRAERARLLRRVAPWVTGLAIVLGVTGYFVREELIDRAKASFQAQQEEQQARLEAEGARQQAQGAIHEAQGARLEAEDAREAARRAEQAQAEALARAASSATEAQTREAQAHAAMQRVQEAREALTRAEGDSTRMHAALLALQEALGAAETARESERRARESERAEAARALEARTETFARERDALTSTLDRARASVTEAQTQSADERARREAFEAQVQQTQAQLETLQGQLRTQEARVRELEAQTGGANSAETLARETSARESAEARVRELETQVRALEQALETLRNQQPVTP
jgi:hypothetical protein